MGHTVHSRLRLNQTFGGATVPFSALNDPTRQCGVVSVATRPPGDQATPRITGGATSR